MKKKNSSYILILLISLIILWWLRVRSKEGFQSANGSAVSKKRFALIIRGEAFRKGHQNNRNDGVSESYDEQKEACMTHKELVRSIESSGYNVDIFIDTYKTQYDKDLLEWYGTNVKDSRFHEKKFSSQRELIKDAVNMLKDTMHTYDAIMILRIDIFLKEKFINEYDPSTETVQFPFVLWTLNIRTPDGNPMLADTIFHFPKQHYDKLRGLYEEKSWGDSNHAFLDIIPLEHNVGYSLMTKYFHDSDSAKDFNPYYKMIGRPESDKWHDGESKEFPRDFWKALTDVP
jgi:hypothetical protein